MVAGFASTTGRRKAAVLADRFESAFAPMREDRDWWPNTTKKSVWTLVHVREFGPAKAVETPEWRSWLRGALGEWGARRGGDISSSRLSRRLLAPDFRRLLDEASAISLSRFEVSKDGEILVELFRLLEGIKSTNAQVMAVSKTLYHLLPELIVPFDGEVTCTFFDWSSLPSRAGRDWLLDVYAVLADLAAAVGGEGLRALGTPGWPLDHAVAQVLRLGEGRVIDFGLEGYNRSAQEPWFVS